MKKIFSITFFALFSLSIFGQNGMNKERIEAFRTQFYTKKLQLTSEEGQGFWPIFNKMEKDKESLKKKYRPDRKFELMNDSEVENFIADRLAMEEEALALKRKYVEELKSVLPIRKVAMVFRVEQQFKKRLLEEVQKRRQERQNRNK